MANPFATAGEWLRCALHAHTTNSDGELPPEALARHYEAAGFDVLVITDHWARTTVDSSAGLLVIPGTELDAALGEPGREAHVLGLGVEEDPELPANGFPPLQAVVDWVEEANGVPYLAHPYWSGLRADEFENCKGLMGLEVYNAGCELEVGRGLAGVHWDDVLERGGRWFGIATDDSHHPGLDSSLAWTWVRAPKRSEAAVLGALRAGAFYGTTGPTIHDLAHVDGAIHVRTSPARRITLMTGRTRGASVNAGEGGYSFRGAILEQGEEGGVVAARLSPPRQAPYARLEVVDAHGRKAWTNPLWN